MSSSRRRGSFCRRGDEAYIGGKEATKHESKRLNLGRGGVGKTAEALAETFSRAVLEASKSTPLIPS